MIHFFSTFIQSHFGLIHNDDHALLPTRYLAEYYNVSTIVMNRRLSDKKLIVRSENGTGWCISDTGIIYTHLVKQAANARHQGDVILWYPKILDVLNTHSRALF